MKRKPIINWAEAGFVSLFAIMALIVYAIKAYPEPAYWVLFLPTDVHDLLYFCFLLFFFLWEGKKRRYFYTAFVSLYMASIFIAANVMQAIDFRHPGQLSQFSIFLDAAVYSCVTLFFTTFLTLLITKGVVKFANKVKLLYGLFLTFLAGNVVLTFYPMLYKFESHLMAYDTFVYLMLYGFVLSCFRWFSFGADILSDLSRLLRHWRLPIFAGKK